MANQSLAFDIEVRLGARWGGFRRNRPTPKRRLQTYPTTVRALMKLLAPMGKKPRKMTDSLFMSWLGASVIRGIALPSVGIYSSRIEVCANRKSLRFYGESICGIRYRGSLGCSMVRVSEKPAYTGREVTNLRHCPHVWIKIHTTDEFYGPLARGRGRRDLRDWSKPRIGGWLERPRIRRRRHFQVGALGRNRQLRLRIAVGAARAQRQTRRASHS